MVQWAASECEHNQQLHEEDRKNITNHSTLKTLVKKLKKAGVDGKNIKAITGHKSGESLNDYVENDIEDHYKQYTHCRC